MKMKGKISLIALLFMPLSILLHGFVLTKLWFWFMIPIFNVPTLSIPQIYGLSILICFFIRDSSLARIQIEEFSKEELISYYINPYVGSAIFLLVGWIISLFL